ncbi:MAG: apolipoprotein A1/A4/E family protein [Chloroflexaceae bacterium]|nr:apolipoprotein A1/A4/E family protein [Chloroflexaceae bacterium]
MATAPLGPRVRRLEDLVAEMTSSIMTMSRRVDRLTENIDRLSYEMRQEMREFRQEMRESHEHFSQEMRESHEHFSQEMRESHERFEARMEASHERFKAEMRESHEHLSQEMRTFKDNAEREDRKLRQHLAEVSDRMGTLAEDLIAPSIPGILKQVVNCSDTPTMSGVRIQRRSGDRFQEYDVLVVCREYALINETKSRMRTTDIPAFAEVLRNAREFLPEYADKQIIGALAGLYLDQSMVTYGERQGLIMLGIVGGLVEVLNRPGFVPLVF